MFRDQSKTEGWQQILKVNHYLLTLNVDYIEFNSDFLIDGINCN